MRNPTLRPWAGRPPSGTQPRTPRLVSLFITSAAYRAFRARNAETTVLLVAAVIVMLGDTPLGSLWPPLGAFTGWLIRTPVTGAYRAIQMGATLGALAMALRIVFGIERTHVGG